MPPKIDATNGSLVNSIEGTESAIKLKRKRIANEIIVNFFPTNLYENEAGTIFQHIL